MPIPRPHPRPISRRDLFRRRGNWLAFGFGVGLIPLAPGTAGALLAIPFYLLLQPLLVAWSGWLYVGAVAVAFMAGVMVCARAAESIAAHDHPGIVWDEMVGMWVTLCLVPFSWSALLVGFLLFRLLDIVKPWPISLLDRRVGGGLGIMLDDVVAGIFANLMLRLVLPYLP